jgi:cyclophilin family peptidyl-prolyl cis-trans isomerase
MFETDWEQFQLKRRNKQDPSTETLVFIDNHCIGGTSELCQLAVEKYKYIEVGNQATYLAEAESSYIQMISSPSKQYVLWHIKIGEGSEKKVVIELDKQNCPRTSDNFWQLANGYKELTYQGTTIHRVVQDGYIEGGFIQTGSNKSHSSIFGEFFDDENYSFKHNRPGVVGMSKFDRGQNGSVFYITLRPLPHLDGRMVAFGRVVEGMEVIRNLGAIPCNSQRPVTTVVITKSQNYLNILMPTAGESRPKSHKFHGSSKLENADMETLSQRRLDILKEIEICKQELEQQKAIRNMIAEMIASMTAD